MKIKRLISALLCGTVMSAMLSFSAFALTFPDVEGDATVSWAKDAINNMTDLGYIKGYEDGTFRPTRAVSKVETLILMSRILGVLDDEYAQTVDWARDAHSATVNAINTTYVDELSYLMYFDVLSIADLRDYASAANANTSLLRWQAAYLMDKLAGKESEAKSATLDENTYSDYDSIPAAARPYVAYATKLGLMNGMGNDENGKAYFSPETTLTRAQMATLLNRMIEKMDRTYSAGTIENIDYDTASFTVDEGGEKTDCSISENTIIKLNGGDAEFDELDNGYEVMVTYTFGDTRIIEAVPAQTKTTLYGIVVQTKDGANGKQITIKDSEDQASQATYTFADNCTYYVKGSKGAFGDIKSNDFVRLDILGDKVITCATEDKTIEVNGLFKGYDTKGDYTYVTVADQSTGEETTYSVSSNTLNVTRNNLTANLRDIAKYDSVTMKLQYGKVVQITAVSKSSDVTGTIVQIVLSDKPSITIKNGKDESEYSLTSNTKVKVNGVDATIYDLRPNNAATLKLDGTSVASIESSATSSTGKTNVTGKVVSINSTLKVITVTNEMGGTDTVYYDSKTTFLKGSTGKAITAKDVVAGSNISATGSDSTGYFVATIIIAD